MKRFSLIFIILISICIPLFSVTVIDEQKYIFTVTGSSDKNSIDIGFSSIPIDTWDVKPVHPMNNTLPLIIDVNTTTGEPIAKTDLNSIYLYWRLVTTKKITVNIKLKGNMEHKPDNSLLPPITDPNPLAWELSWIPYDSQDGNSSNAGEEAYTKRIKPGDQYTEIVSFKSQPSALALFGHVPILIKTASLKDRVLTGNYEGIVEVQVLTE